jgi:hypothetical protein
LKEASAKGELSMKCPICGEKNCDRLMHDLGHPARAVGKQIALLGSGQAQGPATTKTGISAGPDEQTPERDADQDRPGIIGRFPTHESGARQATAIQLLAEFPFARS